MIGIHSVSQSAALVDRPFLHYRCGKCLELVILTSMPRYMAACCDIACLCLEAVHPKHSHRHILASSYLLEDMLQRL